MDQDDRADAQLWVQLGERREDVEHVEDVSSDCSPPGGTSFLFPGGIFFKRHTIFGLDLRCRLAPRHFTIHRFIRLLADIWARPAFCGQHYTLASWLLGIRFYPSARPDDAFRDGCFEIAEPKGGRGYAGVKNTIVWLLPFMSNPMVRGDTPLILPFHSCRSRWPIVQEKPWRNTRIPQRMSSMSRPLSCRPKKTTGNHTSVRLRVFQSVLELPLGSFLESTERILSRTAKVEMR